jgi:branched-chain amino acid transport system permease protein
MTQFLQLLANGVVVGSTYALVALGLSLIFGALEVPDFSHGVFIMLGAYVTYFLVTELHVNFFLAIPVVMLVMGIAGSTKELFVFRALRSAGELPLMLVAFALFQFIQNWAVLFFGGQFSRDVEFPVQGRFVVGGVILTYQRMTVVITALLVIVAISLFVSHTQSGRAIRAVAEDPDSAVLTGINVSRVHTLVFFISTALAGLAGLLLSGLIPVEPYMGGDQLLKAFAIIVLGGMGNVRGTLVGALALGIVENIATGYLPSAAYSDGIAFAVLVVVLLWRPDGLVTLSGKREV